MNLTINFELQKQDYADFIKYQFIKTKLKNAIILGLFLLLALLWFINKDKFNWATTIVYSLFFIIVYLIGMLRTLKKMQSIKDDSDLLGLIKYEFTEDGITCESKASSSYSKWSVVKALKESPKAFFLVNETNVAILVPKRCFTTSEQANEFKEFITNKIANK